MPEINLCETRNKLLRAYSEQTCHPSYKHKWTPERPSVGQCAITALYLHETFGYNIYDIVIGRTRHFFNKDLSGNIIDLTADQFDHEIVYDIYRLRNPKDVMKSTKDRYAILKSKMQNL